MLGNAYARKCKHTYSDYLDHHMQTKCLWSQRQKLLHGDVMPKNESTNSRLANDQPFDKIYEAMSIYNDSLQYEFWSSTTHAEKQRAIRQVGTSEDDKGYSKLGLTNKDVDNNYHLISKDSWWLVRQKNTLVYIHGQVHNYTRIHIHSKFSPLTQRPCLPEKNEQ